MRRAVVALIPCLASCGLLMDFEPGSGDGGASGTGVSSSSPTSGTSTATDTTSASTDKGPSSSASSGKGGASSSGGGDGGGGEGGEGGAGAGGGGPTARWSVRIGGSGVQEVRTIAVSAAGRVAVAGDFTGTMNVGGTDLAAGDDMTATFVAAIDPEGNIEWARKLTDYDPGADPEEHDDLDVAFTSDEGLVVTGSYDRSVTLDTTLEENGGFANVFAVKYGTDGQFIWGATYGDGDDTQKSGGVAIRPLDDHVVMAGFYCGDINFFGGCSALDTVGCGTQKDIWLAELDAGGGCVRSKRVGTDDNTSFKVVDDVAVDDNGRIALIGRFDGTLAFGGTATSLQAINAPNDETYVALLDGTFGGIRATRLDGFGFGSVVFDPLAGFRFAGTMQPPVLGVGTPAATYNFVTGYVGEDGVASLRSMYGGPTNDSGFGVVGPDNTWRAYGYFTGDAVFGSAGTLAADEVDAFMTTIDGSGNPIDGVEVIGGAGNQGIAGAGFDQLDREFIAGNYDSPTTVDGVPFVSLGATDIFVVAR